LGAHPQFYSSAVIYQTKLLSGLVQGKQ